MPRHLFVSVLLSILAMFSACKKNPSLASRVQAAGGADALKAECLGFIAAYEASSGKKMNLFSGQTNFPPTIAALQPRAVQVGRQGSVILVHLGFVTGPHPYGIYVAPRGCPSDFLPERPLGSTISMLAEGVFEYRDNTGINMPLLVLGTLVVLTLIAIWQGFVPPPHASTLIRFRDGVVQVRRGQLRAGTSEHIADILRDVGVSRGFIAITPGNWVAFSRSIPPTVHQRLRNVLLNQWA